MLQLAQPLYCGLLWPWEMNMFGTGDEHIYCWRQKFLALEAKVFIAGDEHVKSMVYYILHLKGIVHSAGLNDLRVDS